MDYFKIGGIAYCIFVFGILAYAWSYQNSAFTLQQHFEGKIIVTIIFAPSIIGVILAHYWYCKANVRKATDFREPQK